MKEKNHKIGRKRKGRSSALCLWPIPSGKLIFPRDIREIHLFRSSTFSPREFRVFSWQGHPNGDGRTTMSLDRHVDGTKQQQQTER